MQREEKRGISPVIATTLLILIGVTLAVIIFLWARSFVAEKAQKTVGSQPEAIEQFCDDVDFDADVVSYNRNAKTLTVDIINRGDIPIHGVEIRKKSAFSVKIIGDNGPFDPLAGITSGESRTGVVVPDKNSALSTSAPENLIIVPVLLGTVGDSQEYKSYACADEFGVTDSDYSIV
jgi:hypothetical protein